MHICFLFLQGVNVEWEGCRCQRTRTMGPENLIVVPIDPQLHPKLSSVQPSDGGKEAILTVGVHAGKFCALKSLTGQKWTVTLKPKNSQKASILVQHPSIKRAVPSTATSQGKVGMTSASFRVAIGTH